MSKIYIVKRLGRTGESDTIGIYSNRPAAQDCVDYYTKGNTDGSTYYLTLWDVEDTFE